MHHSLVDHTLVLDLGFVIELHPQPTHHGNAALVGRIRNGDDPRQPERLEGVIEPSGGCLRGIAPPPVLAGESPPHLDLVGV